MQTVSSGVEDLLEDAGLNPSELTSALGEIPLFANAYDKFLSLLNSNPNELKDLYNSLGFSFSDINLDSLDSMTAAVGEQTEVLVEA